MSKIPQSFYLRPDWPAPPGISCLVTTRQSGRELLQNEIGKENSLQWVKQVHGSKVVTAPSTPLTQNEAPEGDALYTSQLNRACGILTADCLPVFFCDGAGDEIAVAHAGWRGLVGGVLENTLSCFKARPKEIMAWLGPAIGPCHFEVGGEVKEAFMNASDNSKRDEICAAFIPVQNSEKWMADLFKLARTRLSAVGVEHVYGGGICTYCNDDTYYSYRKNKLTGRFASIIWKN